METLSAMPSAAAHEQFREIPPETLTVNAAELWERLPLEFRAQGKMEDGDSLVELPCGELFRGNTPRISLGVLQTLMPSRLHIPDGVDLERRIPIPPAWLAARYKLVKHKVETPTKNPTKEVVTEVPQAAPHQEIHKPSFFSSLPTFHRHAPQPGGKVIKEEDVVVDEMAKDEASGELTEISVPALERLWKMDPKDQFADPGPLQALFMTDEKPTLERVVSLAGELPGLRACVLVHGERVLCSSTATTGIDLRSLSGQAMNLLSKIRESSAGMGLGSVPAITLHAEQGVLSFLYEGELCLLVLHADRAFVPGVRERLQQMLGHLSQAQALSGGESGQPTLPI